MRARRVVALAALVGVSLLGACQSTAIAPAQPIDRILIVSLPGVAWEDVRAGSLPALQKLVGEAAIGDVSTRIGRRSASTTDAYLSIGAGTRALAPSVDVAVAVDPDESYGGVRTADILRRRLGRVPDGVAYLAVGAAIDRNERSAFGAVPGRLGTLLAGAGVRRAVIANADSAEGFPTDEPPPDGAYARGAATALMGRSGIVPEGKVGRGLLVSDPVAPFGRRLDHDAVLAAFDEVWAAPGRAVVLVEASDLSRASAYAARTTPEQGRALRVDALASSDALLAELLARTDSEHDAVVVLSPIAPTGAPDLAVAVLRAPGVDQGLLRSSTTRRDGYVQLADVAPTVLSLLGEPQPDEIEGRPMEVRPDASPGRVARLDDETAAAARRDGLMPIVVPTIIGGLLVLVVSTVLALRSGRLRETPLMLGAFVALGVVPATFLASHAAFVETTASYLVATLGAALVLGTGSWMIERRWRGVGPIVAVGLIVALFTVDVILGAPLQVNAVFGYSVAVAGRFVGLGNLAFALFGAAAIVLAGLVVDRRGKQGVPMAMALLALVVVIEGLPMLGADVGGVISMVPAFGVTAMVLAERQVRIRHLAGLVAAAGATVMVFAFVDLARPPGSRTHLARLAEHVVHRRWEPVGDSLSRRLQASFGGIEAGAWAIVIPLLVVGGTWTFVVARGWVDPRLLLRQGHPPTTAVLAGLAVLAMVGLVANDSSIAVPTTMLIVLAPAAVLRAVAQHLRSARVDMRPA